jgi:hypothetical protein
MTVFVSVILIYIVKIKTNIILTSVLAIYGSSLHVASEGTDDSSLRPLRIEVT